MNSRGAHALRHTLDGTLWVTLAEGLLLPVGLLTTAFLTRRLGPDGYGLFTLAATLVAWIEWSIVALWTRATIQVAGKFAGRGDSWKPLGAAVMRLHLAAGVGAMLLLWLLAGPLASLLRDPKLEWLLRVFALDIPLFCVAFAHRNLLAGLGRFRPRALATGGRWTARLLLTIVLVELGLSIQGAVLGSIGASLVELLACRIFIRPGLSGGAGASRQLWDCALPLFFFAVTMRLFDKVDLFALKMLGASAREAGFYGAAQNLTLIAHIFAGALSPLLLASLSRALHAGDAAAARHLARHAQQAALCCLPLAGIIAGASSGIVRWIFGPEFSPAAPPLAVLIFGAAAFVMLSVVTTILTAAGKPMWTFALAAPLLAASMAGCLLVVPRWGTMGAAWVSTLCTGACALAGVLMVQRLWRIVPSLLTVARSLVVCGGCSLASLLWPASGAGLLLKLPLLAGASLLLLGMLGEFGSWARPQNQGAERA